MVNGNELLRQTVESVLQTNKKEWFLNWEEGINIYNILGKRKSDEIIQNEIAQGLLQVDSSFLIEDFHVETEGREMKISFTAKNSNGETVTISNMGAGRSSGTSYTASYFGGYRYSSSYPDISHKANKATTLAGYGITDAYTQEQTNSAISAALVNAPYLSRTTVERLPDLSVANINTIYVLYEDSESENNKYTEWMVINGKWEQTGGSDIVDITADEIDALYGEV